jgi:hypothetical protein
MDRKMPENVKTQLDPSLDFLRPVVIDDLRRIGTDQDGGYIISQKTIAESTALLSLGVGDDWSFDQQWHAIKPLDIIHAYDGSVDWSQISDDGMKDYNNFWRHPRIHFPVNVGPNRDTGIVGFDRAMTVINSSQVFVKMDIEGGEWELIKYLCLNQHSITGMIIEFHDVGRLRDWFINSVHQLQRYFGIIHVHGNNTCFMCDDGLPSVIELSFAHQKFLPADSITRSRLYLPQLDRPNHPDIPDIEMEFID